MEVLSSPQKIHTPTVSIPSDEKIIAMWLHGRPASTQKKYAATMSRFRSWVPLSLAEVRLGDIQDFTDALTGLSPATQAATISTIKSLFSFAHRLGYIKFNVAAPVQLPKVKNTLAERILTEEEVHRMIIMEPNPRNKLILKLLYVAGLRVSELCSLTWKDLQPREEGGQVTVFGKGGKTRAILLPVTLWKDLVSYKANYTSANDPVFYSRKRKGFLTPVQVHRIVKKAADRAELERDPSCHWLRHAHASHALDRGAPIHLVQETLGHESVATTGRYLHARPLDSSSRYLSI